MIQAASGQLADILDDLGLAARIEAGRYAPNVAEADTLELAQAAAGLLGEKAVRWRNGRRGPGRPGLDRARARGASRVARSVTAASSRSS